jgi:hypothetical protein
MLAYLLLAGLGLLIFLPLLAHAGSLRKTDALKYTPTKREHVVWPFVVLLAAAIVYCLYNALAIFLR